MGTIIPRKRKSGSTGYHAQVLIKRGGAIVHRESRTFDRKQAAAAWLDRPRDSKDNLGVGFAANGDPRRNPFDWEVWHECDVFRAEVERRLAA